MSLDFATTYPEKVEKMVLLCLGGLAPEKSSFLWKAIFFTFLGKYGKNKIIEMVNGGKIPESEDEGLKKGMEFTMFIGKILYQEQQSSLFLMTF